MVLESAPRPYPVIRRARTATTNNGGTASLTTVRPWRPILNKAMALLG